MKRKIILLIIIFVLLLTGCRLNYDKSLVLNEPPKLYIEYEKNTIETLKGGYSWTVYDRFDKATSTIADSMHPLQCKEIAPVITKNNDKFMKLNFEIEPEKVTVRAWSDKHWNNIQFADNNFTIVDVIGNNINLLDDESGVIYEVTATWKLEGYYEGTGSYIIYVKNR